MSPYFYLHISQKVQNITKNAQKQYVYHGLSVAWLFHSVFKLQVKSFMTNNNRIIQ